jgi:hypothetical protein
MDRLPGCAGYVSKPPGRARVAWGAAAAFSVLMALSRAYLGAHWLSDALAGVLLGASCALLAAFAVGELQGRRTAHRAARSAIRPSRAPSVRLTGDEQPPVAVPAGHLPPSSRYRHPGDVIRLISAGLLLPGAFAA